MPPAWGYILTWWHHYLCHYCHSALPWPWSWHFLSAREGLHSTWEWELLEPQQNHSSPENVTTTALSSSQNPPVCQQGCLEQLSSAITHLGIVKRSCGTWTWVDKPCVDVPALLVSNSQQKWFEHSPDPRMICDSLEQKSLWLPGLWTPAGFATGSGTAGRAVPVTGPDTACSCTTEETATFQPEEMDLKKTTKTIPTLCYFCTLKSEALLRYFKLNPQWPLYAEASICILKKSQFLPCWTTKSNHSAAFLSFKKNSFFNYRFSITCGNYGESN